MNWSVIRPALKAWVESITGLSAKWRRASKGWAPKEGYCLLDITGMGGVGSDEVVDEYDEDAEAGSEIRTYQTGQRQFTFNVQVRTWSTTDGLDSKHYASLIMNSTDLPRKSSEVFAAAGIGFAGIAGTVGPLPFEQDGRPMDVSDIQLRFNGSESTEDEPTTYIETIGITVEGRNPDGDVEYSVTRDIKKVG